MLRFPNLTIEVSGGFYFFYFFTLSAFYILLFFSSDYVYFENSSSNPYLIRRIEELNKVGGCCWVLGRHTCVVIHIS